MEFMGERGVHGVLGEYFAGSSADLEHRRGIDALEKQALNPVTNFNIILKRAWCRDSEMPYLGLKFWREDRKLRKFRW